MILLIKFKLGCKTEDGNEMMFPVSSICSPCGNVGAIISNADMYCELTSPGNEMEPPCNGFPDIRSGGYPSLFTYSMEAPMLRSASTKIRIGRCCMRSLPVSVTVPSVMAK